MIEIINERCLDEADEVAHAWSCECRACLGSDYDRYHANVAREDREMEGDYR